jgi:hypothetical protein
MAEALRGNSIHASSTLPKVRQRTSTVFRGSVCLECAPRGGTALGRDGKIDFDRRRK